LLSLNNISISFKNASSKKAVNNISFSVAENEIVAIVGESGSGKSVTALSILRLLPKSSTISGSILFEAAELLNASENRLQHIRGNKIGMIFQEPMSSLNPSLTCGSQVVEVLLQHQNIKKSAAKKLVLALFEKVKLPRPAQMYGQYPHQLSGGQQQRVMIAMAIACKPKLLIADEPTTALDATVQKEIIQLLKSLQSETGMSILFITHDLNLAAQISNRVLVMQHGAIVEQGITSQIFSNPQQLYTKALLNARPHLTKRLKKLPTVDDFINKTVSKKTISISARAAIHRNIYEQPPLLEINNIKKYFKVNKGSLFAKQQFIKAVDGVSLKIYEGETKGLVGESGCGKTTLGRLILQLEKPTAGEILFNGKDITKLPNKELKSFRKQTQIIFQDPYASLNPRITIGKSILDPMRVHGILNSTAERKLYVETLLKRVGLLPEHFYRYPHEFSGGQRQRICIARAIALQPKLIVCDESVSALDVSVQAQILNLLNELKALYKFTYLFISHDLAVVKYMSDELVVMNQGKIEEMGEADTVFNNPSSEYTRRLVGAF